MVPSTMGLAKQYILLALLAGRKTRRGIQDFAAEAGVRIGDTQFFSETTGAGEGARVHRENLKNMGFVRVRKKDRENSYVLSYPKVIELLFVLPNIPFSNDDLKKFEKFLVLPQVRLLFDPELIIEPRAPLFFMSIVLQSFIMIAGRGLLNGTGRDELEGFLEKQPPAIHLYLKNISGTSASLTKEEKREVVKLAEPVADIYLRRIALMGRK